MKSIMVLAMTLSIALAHAAVAAKLDYAALVGEWTVQGVKVLDQGNVQALLDNDPQYMKAVVDFQTDKIVWIKGHESPSNRS